MELTKQNRTITLGDYRFNEEDHLHELLKDGEYKPLTGVTTVLGVIAKPMLIQWAANQACDFIGASAVKEIIAETPEGEKVWTGKYLIDDAMLKEARVAHRKKKESAGEWGTEIHTKIEHLINFAIDEGGGYLQTSGHADKSINHFIHWAVTNKVKFLASEKHVYSKEMWVGGICDIICEIDGKRYVGDIKTSSGIYPEAFIQCSAYAEMLVEMGEYKSVTTCRPYTAKDDLDTSSLCETTPAFDGVVILNLKKDGTFDYKYNYDIEGNFKCFEAALTIYRQLQAIK